MARFEIKNDDLKNFAKFSQLAMQKEGFFVCDCDDHVKFVEQGNSEYFFGCGDTLTEAVQNVKSKISKTNFAKKVFVLLEISNEIIQKNNNLFVEIKTVLDNFDNLVVDDINKQGICSGFKLYVVDQSGVSAHILINF